MSERKSRFGEGTGATSQICSDPNNPSFDPATHRTTTTDRLAWLINSAWDQLNSWEQGFCSSVYGMVPMSRKQHRCVARLYRKYLGRKS